MNNDPVSPPPTPVGPVESVDLENTEINETDNNEEQKSQTKVTDDDFRDTCIDIIVPSLETDVRDMVKGRVLWRRISTVFEVLGRLSGATGTIIAFAGSSDITGETLSRAFAFSAGCLGTTSIVSTLFATFARHQSIERSTAINKILQSIDVTAIPDIAKALEIQGTNNDQS